MKEREENFLLLRKLTLSRKNGRNASDTGAVNVRGKKGLRWLQEKPCRRFREMQGKTENVRVTVTRREGKNPYFRKNVKSCSI